MDDQQRYRQRSLWLDGALAQFTPRAPLAGDHEADVAIVGAGYTGLWTAYALTLHDPSLRIAVVEAETVGYGASGRNGGFVSAGIAGEARVYSRRAGMDDVIRAERAMIAGIDWIGAAVEREAIECGWVKSGAYRIATSRPQLDRLRTGLEAKRARGFTEDDLRLVDPAEIEADVRIPGLLAGTYTPHCARVDPARLVRGLADACERRGVVIFERSAATAIEQGRVRTASGTITAASSCGRPRRSRPGFPGEGRSYLPLASHMLATEPLPREIWDEIGWASCAPIADQRYQFAYAQRTPDGRIALGGRGLTYKLGGPIREADEAQAAIHAQARADAPPALPGGGSGAGQPSLGLLLRRTARLVHGGRLRSRDRPRARRRVLGPRRRGVEPRRTHARGPDRRGRHRAHRPAVGRPHEPALGAGAAPVHRCAHHRHGRRERRRGRGQDGPAGTADRNRAAVAAGAVAEARATG